MRFRAFKIGAAALVVTCGFAWAANNFRMSTSGGTVTTFKSTDNAGVQTPHVNCDNCASGSSDATAANQVTGNNSLASILAKIIAAPATEAKQDTGNTSLASILAKIIAAPATEAKQDTQITALQPATNLTIVQVSVATSDTGVVASRALRRAVTVQQITGTQNVFCNETTATAANGVVLPAVVGASFTFNTTSAIRCIAITGAQTVAVAETY